MPEITVTSQRFALSLRETAQQIDVIDSQDIMNINPRSVDEMLRYLSSVDVIQRGPFGIQSDVSLRGAGFEQTLFLINGMRVNDPQTGHFHSDVPIAIGDIERIEVMYGGSGALYGHGGFGGIVNIVTKGKTPSSISGDVVLGGYGYSKKSAAFTAPQYKGVQLRLSLEDQKSSGYRTNTDFSTQLFNASITADNWELLGGFSEKRFGANGFYSSKYPMQWEHTRSSLLSGKARLALSEISLEPSFLYRHHYDYYVLDRYNQDFYRNTHDTNTFSLQLPLFYSSKGMRFAAGAELSYDDIDSSRLGTHSRQHRAVFASLNKEAGLFNLNLDLRLDHYSGGVGFEASPSLGISYSLKDAKIRLSTNRSFRLPSYTELYYTSPAHISNPFLKPESAWQVETGIDIFKQDWTGSLSVFQRWGQDIIDWVSNGDYWRSENIRRIDTSGVSANLSATLKGHTLKAGYTWLNQRGGADLPANYANYLIHKANIQLTSSLPLGFKSIMMLTFQKRINQPSYALFDARINRDLIIGEGKLDLFFEVRNLFNKAYQDITGLPMPGRWLFAGLQMRM